MTIRLKGLVLIIFLLFGDNAFAQDDEFISQIKNRYSALNKNIPTAAKTSIDNLTYFIIDNRIVKANIRTDSLNYEFYYDKELNGQTPFFILSTKEISNRYYFNREDLIKWIEDKKEVTFKDDRYFFYSFLLNNISKDLLIIYKNWVQNKTNSSNSEKVKLIDEQLNLIEEQKVRIDTVNKIINKEESYFEMEYAYYDLANRLIKSKKTYSTEHGDSETFKYYLNDKLICEIEKRHSWAGQMDWHNETFYYYEKEHVFRKIFKTRNSLGPSNNGQLTYKLVDEIQDN